MYKSFITQYQLLDLEVFQHELYPAFNVCTDICMIEPLLGKSMTLPFNNAIVKA